MVELRQSHWIIAKHVLQYLKGRVHYGLKYVGDGEFMLHGFIDSNYVGYTDDKNSSLRYCFIVGSRVISWINGK
jgi:hypothetical protein